MECSFDKNPAIITSGKCYCEHCIGKYEVIFFEQALMKKFTSKHEMIAFFEWAFGSDTPKFSDLQKWHDKIPRPERNGNNWRSHGIYVESQDCYICRIADEYLRSVK